MCGLLSQRLLISWLEVFVLLSMLILETIAGEGTTAAAICCGSWVIREFAGFYGSAELKAISLNDTLQIYVAIHKE